MSLTEQDKIQCAAIAGEVIKEVIQYHIQSCPHGKSLMVSRAMVVGMMVGCGLAGGGVGALLFKLFTTGV